MNTRNLSASPCSWKKSILWLALAVVCFQIAYASVKTPALGLFIFGYALALIQLTNQPTVRRAFYFGLVTGFLCYAPQLFFFWKIFSAASIVLWIVLAFWIGLFVAIVCGAIHRWGKAKAMWLVPIIWTGVEYFRSELYYLKFSWLNIGYAFPNFSFAPLDVLGMYGIGFLVFLIASTLSFRPGLKKFQILTVILVLVVPISWLLTLNAALRSKRVNRVEISGIQMEFPSEGVLTEALDGALKQNTNAQIFVLSEYTLDGPPLDSLKDWCRTNSRYLVVGGKDSIPNDPHHKYYNTAFVVGTNGDVVFKQAKSVPIQFFDDGLPAQKQELWNSPFGKIGICICYDLSYTRVTDKLVREGAQLLIVPTMDVSEWGKHEHELHSRVAPVRAAEYGIPIFRLASSGISQAVSGGGNVIAQTSFDKQGEVLSAQLRLPSRGSLPLDRFLAPACTGITAAVLAALLFLSWKEKRLRVKC